jgi:hypothetical protein
MGMAFALADILLQDAESVSNKSDKRSRKREAKTAEINKKSKRLWSR